MGDAKEMQIEECALHSQSKPLTAMGCFSSKFDPSHLKYDCPEHREKTAKDYIGPFCSYVMSRVPDIRKLCDRGPVVLGVEYFFKKNTLPLSQCEEITTLNTIRDVLGSNGYHVISPHIHAFKHCYCNGSRFPVTIERSWT